MRQAATVYRIPEKRSIKRAERENSLGQLFLYMGSRFEVDMSGQGKAHIPSSSSRTVACVVTTRVRTVHYKLTNERCALVSSPHTMASAAAEEDRRCRDGMFRHPRDVI